MFWVVSLRTLERPCNSPTFPAKPADHDFITSWLLSLRGRLVGYRFALPLSIRLVNTILTKASADT